MIKKLKNKKLNEKYYKMTKSQIEKIYLRNELLADFSFIFSTTFLIFCALETYYTPIIDKKCFILFCLSIILFVCATHIHHKNMKIRTEILENGN